MNIIEERNFRLGRMEIGALVEQAESGNRAARTVLALADAHATALSSGVDIHPAIPKIAAKIEENPFRYEAVQLLELVSALHAAHGHLPLATVPSGHTVGIFSSRATWEAFETLIPSGE
jgi:hypothetical protein